MNNVIRMLSVNKDFRMVIADTRQIAEQALSEFRGTDCMRGFLEQIITGCTLLSSINDVNAKISFSFRLSHGVSIFCQITDANFTMEYRDTINEFNGAVAELFDNKSVVSITTGNWETGLHTGTVEAYMDNAAMLFAHFTVQSEQLPSHFIMAGDHASRGLLMQPLPFAAEPFISKAAYELNYHSKELEHMDWKCVPARFRHLAKVISENRIG